MSIPNSTTFWAKRLHSLMGVLPLGAFLCEHMLTNSLAGAGDHGVEFKEAIATLQGLPYLHILELFFIAIPLGYHAIYGLYITITARITAQDYPYPRNVFYTFQRITGVAALIFIAYHLLSTRFAVDPLQTDFYLFLEEHLHSGGMKAFYVFGLVSTVFHFSNGLVTAAMTWGLTVSKRSQLMTSYACSGLGVLLVVLGLRGVFAF